MFHGRWLAPLLLCLCVPAVSVAREQEQVGDPWEGFNRGVYRFNDRADRAIVRPIAVGYKKVMPDPFEIGIHNFFVNLRTPAVALNQLLQGKPKRFGSDVGRFLMNSTVGIAGLVDVADDVGLGAHEEDFGQTFALWGIPAGPYLMIPLMGPSTIRDATGSVIDGLFYPPRFIESIGGKVVTYGIDLLDTRAQLLGADQLISGDGYLFFRDAYLQRRHYLINDGQIDDPFLDDDF